MIAPACGAAAGAGLRAPGRRIPLIAAVKRHSLEDGPGIRTVVFFKGCPLSCAFCQNPETQSPEVEVVFRAGDCIRCGACAGTCPRGAVDMELAGRIRRERCSGCGSCAAACPGRGMRKIGDRYLPEALAELLLRDRPFYRHSGGGVTLSGGEATLYPDFVESLLAILGKEDVRVVLQTCGYFAYGVFERRILPYLDGVYFDIKIRDPVAHRAWTGKDNRRILDNFLRLVRGKRVPVHARIPLVPGITDGRENLSAIVEFLLEAGARDVTLLPYNPLGIGLAASLGRPLASLPGERAGPGTERETVEWFGNLLKEAGCYGR